MFFNPTSSIVVVLIGQRVLDGEQLVLEVLHLLRVVVDLLLHVLDLLLVGVVPLQHRFLDHLQGDFQDVLKKIKDSF